MKKVGVSLILLSFYAVCGLTACEQEETPIPSLIMEYPESMTIPAEGGSLWIDVKYNKEEIVLKQMSELNRYLSSGTIKGINIIINNII